MSEASPLERLVMPVAAAVPEDHHEPGIPAERSAVMMKDDCDRCLHQRSIPGDAHIRCANPDPGMTGNPHGITRGWFYYPFNFDPCWKTKECSNFKEKTQWMPDETI